MELATIALYAFYALVFAAAVYSFYTARKMQKKNKPTVGQLDGSIADEGTSFSDIAGSRPMFGVIVDKFGERTEKIK
ncbi:MULTISPECIES: hypothetical protein [unclassified Acinetobacter]|uniref:hypothetical protein n=1 Tax=unclassified Acinetobacter TaxID=196816 RepID=UPI00257689C9|nr:MULTISPECIES: hypothetical protein [unclassified Acinetobacter]MDM1764616.1 hypothetical protein [Acinetobacter sp. 226-1]MDM1768612.1 hypothetical protein [Acinetobacter sp. 226-4]